MLHVDNYLKILNLTIVIFLNFILKLETYSVRQVKYTPYKQFLKVSFLYRKKYTSYPYHGGDRRSGKVCFFLQQGLKITNNTSQYHVL